MPHRSALLIRCSVHEAEAIRARAKAERRTISAFVLKIVAHALDFEESLEGRLLTSPSFRAQSSAFCKNPQPKVGPRTALLVRCSIAEADRIRGTARRRQVLISEYVLHCVRRTFYSSGHSTAPDEHLNF